MDWEKHFRSMKRPAVRPVAFGADFGTVAGKHTVAELRDLLSAHQFTIDRVERDYNARALELSRVPDNATWVADWKAFKARWEPARARAQVVIETWHPLADNLTPAQDEYAAVLQAVQVSYPELRTSHGDLVDLVNRLAGLGVVVDLSAMPQPSPTSDAEFNAFQSANAVTSRIDSAIQAVTPSRKLLIMGGVALGLTAFFLLPKALRGLVPVRF